MTLLMIKQLNLITFMNNKSNYEEIQFEGSLNSFTKNFVAIDFKIAISIAITDTYLQQFINFKSS